MWDAFDLATVSLTVTEIAKEFGVQNSEVTWVGLSAVALTTREGDGPEEGLHQLIELRRASPSPSCYDPSARSSSAPVPTVTDANGS